MNLIICAWGISVIQDKWDNCIKLQLINPKHGALGKPLYQTVAHLPQPMIVDVKHCTIKRPTNIHITFIPILKV